MRPRVAIVAYTQETSTFTSAADDHRDLPGVRAGRRSRGAGEPLQSRDRRLPARARSGRLRLGARARSSTPPPARTARSPPLPALGSRSASSPASAPRARSTPSTWPCTAPPRPRTSPTSRGACRRWSARPSAPAPRSCCRSTTTPTSRSAWSTAATPWSRTARSRTPCATPAGSPLACSCPSCAAS